MCENKMGGGMWHTYGRREMYAVVWQENLTEKDYLLDVGVEGGTAW